MLLAALLVVTGLAALTVGGDALVEGAAGLAHRLGLPPLVVGITIVSFGTSAPELAVAVVAALEGSPDLAVGNVFGSNVFNVLVAAGAAAVVAPLTLSPTLWKRELPLVLLATLLVMGLGLSDGELARWEGAVLLALLVSYVGWILARAIAGKEQVPLDDDEDAELDAELKPAVLASAGAVLALVFGAEPHWAVGGIALGAILIVGLTFAARRVPVTPLLVLALLLGLGMLMAGSELLVDGASTLAYQLGVSEAVVGLTVVAIGTSAPELATTISAARAGESDLALGNALGSNLFNLLCVLGAASFITPVAFSERFLLADGWVAFAATLVLVPFCFRDRVLGRRRGMVLVALWAAYTAYLAIAGG